jgi:PAS domain S-box-containing protein
MTSTDYLNLLDQSPTAIIVSNANEQIIFTNDYAKNTFGLDPQVSADLSIKKFFAKYSYKWSDVVKKVHQKGFFTMEGSVVKISGGVIEVSVLCKAISFNNEPATACFIRDISDQQIIIREHFKEQQFKQVLLDSIPAMIFVKDTVNRLIAINRAYQDITGSKPEDLLGKKISELIDNQELAESYWQDDLEVIQSGIPKRNIIEPLITDSKRWFVTDKIPYKTLAGEIIGVIGFSIEITDRKNAEDALLASEKKFRLLFDTSPDGVVLSELDGKIISTNQTFLNMMGYTIEEVINMSFFDFISEEDKESELPTLQGSVLFGDTISSVERNYIKKDGTVLPVIVKGWIIKDESGAPIQMGAFIKDNTIQAKIESFQSSFIQRDQEQLEEDLELKNQELNSKIAQLIEKKGLLLTIHNQLKSIIEEKPDNIIDALKEIVSDLQQDSSEDFWSQFELTFGHINKTFYDNLYGHCPNLTSNEKKIAAFISMSMSTKEISNITHQTIRSIEMARTRLRGKLGLSRDQNLTAFLSQL